MNEKILGYNVERKKIKNINIRIKEDLSIYISAPINLPRELIENFIISKKEFIDRSIRKIQNYKKNFIEETYENDTNIKFLGRLYNLKVIVSNYDKVSLINNQFILNTQKDDYDYKRKIFKTYFYNYALKLFTERINIFKNVMNEDFNRLIIKEIKGKWGYCEVNKKIIALNTNLIKRTLFEIDYVIIHELAHLKYPNHSKSFYRHIEVYMPNYKEAEEKLKYK